MTATYIVGDVGDVLATIPDDSIDLVMTSPPFLALRSYLPADHPHKDREIGSEPDPATFLDTLLALTAEWRRVLAPHGSIAVELGDTYSGSGGAGGDYLPGGMREGQDPYNGSGWHRLGKRAEQDDQPPNYRKSGTVSASGSARTGEWPLPKSLCGIPHLYHLSLAYGRNLLTGEPSPAGQWLVRNVVAWCRPNPPVGALGDKFRPATSYMTIATPNPKRYFDLDAVRTPPKSGEAGAVLAPSRSKMGYSGVHKPGSPGASDQPQLVSHPAGAPPLDYWVIPTAPYSGSHYATFPPALVEKPIQSMVPQRVCRTCGEPSRRIVASERNEGGRRDAPSNDLVPGRVGFAASGESTYTTIGWTDCGHDDWRTGVVLDPFAGSGTTLMVASGHGRDSIGIDIDERNADLALERVGPLLLTVEHLADRVTP